MRRSTIVDILFIRFLFSNFIRITLLRVVGCAYFWAVIFAITGDDCIWFFPVCSLSYLLKWCIKTNNSSDILNKWCQLLILIYLRDRCGFWVAVRIRIVVTAVITRTLFILRFFPFFVFAAFPNWWIWL
jgi:hypothetical protein